MPNEYVAACVTGTIECAVPGKNPYTCDGGNPTRFFNYQMDSNRWSGQTILPDGLEHGLCGKLLLSPLMETPEAVLKELTVKYKEIARFII